MRVMVFVKPPTALIDAIMILAEEDAKSGKMLGNGGLSSTDQGARQRNRRPRDARSRRLRQRLIIETSNDFQKRRPEAATGLSNRRTESCSTAHDAASGPELWQRFRDSARGGHE